MFREFFSSRHRAIPLNKQPLIYICTAAAHQGLGRGSCIGVDPGTVSASLRDSDNAVPGGDTPLSEARYSKEGCFCAENCKHRLISRSGVHLCRLVPVPKTQYDQGALISDPPTSGSAQSFEQVCRASRVAWGEAVPDSHTVRTLLLALPCFPSSDPLCTLLTRHTRTHTHTCTHERTQTQVRDRQRLYCNI